MPSTLTVVLLSLLLATPAVAFWLWLVILPARMATLCPEECKCDIGGFDITCDGASLTSTLPLNRLTNVRALQLYNNNITLIGNHSFVSLTELKVLGVDWCGLITIKLGAFNGLTELVGLSVNDNKIREITPGTFESLGNLEYLDLSSTNYSTWIVMCSVGWLNCSIYI
jgi:hypothetical protein